MAAGTPPYRPLGGKARALFGWAATTTQRLYLGEDHLLYVSNERFHESYKRFFFRDIQALVLTRNTRRRTINVLLLLGALGCSGLSWAIGAATDLAVGAWLQGIFLALFAGFFALNAALGPTCSCYVKTAVHTQELASLRRVRTAQRVFARVAPLIQEAQAGERAPAAPEAGPVGVAPLSGASLPPPAAPVARHEPGTAHALLFVTLLVDFALTAVDFFVNHLALTFAGVVLTFALVGLLVWALIRQQGSAVGRGLRGAVWGTLGYVALVMFLGYVHFIVMAIQEPGREADQWEWIRHVSEQSPQDSPLLMVVYVISLLGSLVLGLFGMFALLAHRRDYAEQTRSVANLPVPAPAPTAADPQAAP